MNPTREEALFALALEKPTEKRAAFLNAMCEGDPALRQRLEALLAAHDQPDGVLPTQAEAVRLREDASARQARPTQAEFTDEPLDEAVGQTIGRYKLLEKIGEGGCGVVYVAEQTEPVRRRVALKVIKLGMDTKQVVARFEAERQALAMMDHPNIAKVLDAGTTGDDRGADSSPQDHSQGEAPWAGERTPSDPALRRTEVRAPIHAGRPYFVMELVRGIRITDYCDQNNLSTKDRLDLFIKVCQAIQHAHQKGIIHRDIKPSNILVTLHDGVPVPKVIDFGIAKATEGRLTDATVYTQLHQFIGTPAYMSPEQAEMSGLDIDTRSDIYSLGVLLYELLVGKTPFDAKALLASGLDEMRRKIREEEPVRPSTRLGNMAGEEKTTAAKHRGAEVPKLITILRGDLDWIVMKCLEKDRTRRYETANGVAADIKRYLSQEPVIARPPSAAYRLQKAFRRNKIAFTAAAAVATALVVGLIFSTVMFLREHQARRDAARQKDEARKNERQAVAAQAKAERERERARRLSYASDMNVAWRALKENNFAEVMALLEAHIPGPGDTDLREWEWRYFWKSCRGDQLWSLGPMPNEVRGLALLPEGSLVTGTGGQAQIRIWDIERRQIMRRITISPEEFSVSDLAVSPDGRRLAVASWGTKVKLLDTLTLETIGEIEHEKQIWRVNFSPDGKLLSAHGNEDVSVWDLGTRKRLWTKKTILGSPSSTPFSPDGKWLACQVIGGTVALLNPTDGVPIRSTDACNDLCSRLVISPDGRWLAAGNWEGEVILTDSAGGRIRVLTGHRAPVQAVAFSPDSRQLATGGADRQVKLWDLEAGKESATFRGHRKRIEAMVYSADGQRLLTSALDGTVCAWPTHPNRTGQFSVPPARASVRALSRDGRFVASFDTNGLCRVFSTETLSEKGSVMLESSFRRLAIGPEAQEIAAVQPDGTVRVWDLATRKILWSFQAHSNGVDVIAFSPDRNWLATAGRGAEIRVWDLRRKQLLIERAFGGVGYHIGDLVFAHNSSTLAVAAWGRIHLISLRPDAQDKDGDVHIEEASSIDISHDGSLIATGMDEEVRVWDAATLRQVALLRGSLGDFNCISFSPDHHRLVASDNTGVTWLWDLVTGREIGHLESGSEPGQVHPRFQPKGDTLVIAKLGEGLEQLQLLRAPSWAEIAAAKAEEKKKGQQ